MLFPGMQESVDAPQTRLAEVLVFARRSQSLEFDRVDVQETVVPRLPFQPDTDGLSEKPGYVDGTTTVHRNPCCTLFTSKRIA